MRGIAGAFARRLCIGSEDRSTEMSTGAVAAAAGEGLLEAPSDQDSTDESAAKHPERLTPGHAAGEGLGEFIPSIGHSHVTPLLFFFLSDLRGPTDPP